MAPKALYRHMTTGDLFANGWNFWKYKDKKGNLVKLSTVRK